MIKYIIYVFSPTKQYEYIYCNNAINAVNILLCPTEYIYNIFYLCISNTGGCPLPIIIIIIIIITSESANVKEQTSQRRNQTQRHHKQQGQNSCNNVSPRDIVCPRNMCMATLHKGDNDVIIIIIIKVMLDCIYCYFMCKHKRQEQETERINTNQIALENY